MHPVPARRGRPPRLVPGHGRTREALVRAGVASLSEKGFTGTGLDAVLDEVGVPKGSFYHYFPSKVAFSLAIIDAYDTYFAKKLDSSFQRLEASPRERLLHFMDGAAAGMARFGYRRGCVVGNLGQEAGLLPETVRDRLREALRSWEARTAVLFEAAQACGELDAGIDCGRLSAFFWISWEGVVLRAKLERSNEPIATFRHTFMQFFTR